jgi:vacuolar-type H+-ATPase subunit H
MTTNVIKAKSLTEVSAPTVKRAVHDAEEDAARILRDAREQAGQIHAAAIAERDAVLTSARADGYNRGLSEWNLILAEAWKTADEFLARQENQLVHRVLAAGKKPGPANQS